VTGPILLRHRLTVRFSDGDPLGHVNNAAYLTYLEQARMVLWRGQLGFSWRRPGAGEGRRGEGFILARAEVDFRSQAHDGDVLEVRLALAAIGRSSVTYEYEVVDAASGRLVAAARTVQVWFDYDANRSAPIGEALRATLARPVADEGASPGRA
jgi:acyl-CoA thioester hydrolase